MSFSGISTMQDKFLLHSFIQISISISEKMFSFVLSIICRHFGIMTLVTISKMIFMWVLPPYMTLAVRPNIRDIIVSTVPTFCNCVVVFQCVVDFSIHCPLIDAICSFLEQHHVVHIWSAGGTDFKWRILFLCFHGNSSQCNLYTTTIRPILVG